MLPCCHHPCCHPTPLLPPCTLHPAPCTLHPAPCTRRLRPSPVSSLQEVRPAARPPPLAPPSRLPTPTPAVPTVYPCPLPTLHPWGWTVCTWAATYGSRLRPHASRLQPYVARWTRSSSTRPSLSPTPPIAPSGHGLPTPRDRRIRRASRRTVRAALAALVLEAATSGIQAATSCIYCTRLQPYVSQGLRERARAAGRTARRRLPRRPRSRRRAKRCAVATPAGTAAPLCTRTMRTKRAPSAQPKHTTVRYRTTTAPHRYRCAAGALAGRARRSLTGGTRHF